MRPTLVLLPGMHGTGKLFERFVRVIPDGWPIRILSYPPDRVMSYEGILEMLEEELGGEGQMVLVAESYSGPLAVQFAAKNPARVAGVVLSASFIRPPAPRFLRWLVGRWMFWIRPPKFAVRWLVLGRSATDELVDEVRDAIAGVRPIVMARRLADVFEIDCGEALRECKAPILYLAGDEDFLVRRGAVEAIRAIRPDVKICKIDGPHLLLQTHPQEAWDDIQSLLQ